MNTGYFKEKDFGHFFEYANGAPTQWAKDHGAGGHAMCHRWHTIFTEKGGTDQQFGRENLHFVTTAKTDIYT